MHDTTSERYDGGNRLIDDLPAADREASSGVSRGDRITAVYFPIDAVFSVLVELAGGDCYEVDTVGHGGLIGGEILLGVKVAPRSVICQVGGRCVQMPLDAFQHCLAEAPAFSASVHRALLVQWYRAQQTVACNFAHTPVERCARWASMTLDAIGRTEFTFRAEYLSMMLGMQTHLVAEPMATLETIGAISYADDYLHVVSQRRLREAACECYAAPAEYSRRLAVSHDGHRKVH
jgi:CRP-like cAMP-binding protein